MFTNIMGFRKRLNLDGKDFLVGTIFISALGMIKIHIDISKREITHFEKKSFFNMIKVIKKKKAE